MGNYRRYEGRYNKRTVPLATNNNKPWTPTDDEKLLHVWCAPIIVRELRIKLARELGRTYVACDKRHQYLHKLRDNRSDCKMSRI